MIFDGLDYPDVQTYDQLRAAADRSRGYEAAYAGQPDSELHSAAWRGGWAAARALIGDKHEASTGNDSASCGRKVARVGRVDRALGQHSAEAAGRGFDDAPFDGAVPVRASVPAASSLREELARCGIVVIVDYMNLLVRAFHAGAPSTINGVRGMLDTVRCVIEKLSPEYLIFALDGGHVARTQLLPSYKSHRPPKPPELVEQIELGQKALRAIGWPSIRVQDWEADDVIASLVKQLSPVAAAVVVCSSDKDLLQLVPEASIYHPWNGGKTITGKAIREQFNVEPSQIVDYLAMVGDSTDGVPGVEGIGPKKAAELLAKFPDLDAILEAARCSQIAGAAGKRLTAQADAARLSRRLVQLRTDLPVASHWTRFPVSRPRSGWHDRLAKLGLVASAHRLELDRPGFDHGDESSHVEIEWGVIDSFPDVTPVPVDPPAAVEPVISSEIESWPKCLADLRGPAPLLDIVRAIYRTGLSHFQAGNAVSNDWRQTSAHHDAYADGLAGRPLSIDLANYDEAGKRLTLVQSPAPVPDPIPVAGTKSTAPRRTLF